MAALGGFQGKLLDVDLDRHTTRAVPLPSDEVLRAYCGGTGLGLYLLAREITPRMRVTDPNAPVLVMTGPLTGTMAPNSSNWTCINLRDCPSYHVGLSQAHGFFGARLKLAGWDGVIVRGASKTPVYLWVDDGKVELRDATPYWGTDVFETARRIKVDLRDEVTISVAAIGPGGENLVTGASVRADGVWSASRGEAGIAWGAKKLKAIVARGTGRVPVHDNAAATATCAQWLKAINDCTMPPPKRYFTAASPKSQMHGKERGNVPGKNFTDAELQIPWADKWQADASKWVQKAVGSYNCEMACHHETTVTTGPMAGAVVTGYGGEIISEVGPNLGILEPGTVLALSGLVDGMGLSAGEVVRNIAMVMEGVAKGRVTREQLDGLDLTWGNYEAVIEALHKTMQREGIGAILALPPKMAGRALGIEDLAVHMKGTGFNDHDMRIHPGMIFQTQVASGAGPVWQTELGLILGMHSGKSGAPDLGYEYLDPKSPDGMVEAVYVGQKKKLWQDSIGVCENALKRIPGTWDPAIAALTAIVGWEGYSREEALLLGERLVNLQRLISLHLGYRPEDDFDISPRLLQGLDAGPAKGALAAGPYLARWRKEYHDCLNWEPETGVPTPEALKKVGLADFVVGAYPRQAQAAAKGA